MRPTSKTSQSPKIPPATVRINPPLRAPKRVTRPMAAVNRRPLATTARQAATRQSPAKPTNPANRTRDRTRARAHPRPAAAAVLQRALIEFAVRTAHERALSSLLIERSSPYHFRFCAVRIVAIGGESRVSSVFEEFLCEPTFAGK